MSEDFIAHLQDLFALFGPVSARRMFGGHGLYFNGQIIGVVMEDALYLKVDARRDRNSRPWAARHSSTQAKRRRSP